MAEASKVSGEKYRRIFSEYDPIFVDAVISATLSGNLNFFLKKGQMQALSEHVKGKDVVVKFTNWLWEKSHLFTVPTSLR